MAACCWQELQGSHIFLTSAFRVLRALPIEAHRVFYIYSETSVIILRILHKRMDPAQINWPQTWE